MKGIKCVLDILASNDCITPRYFACKTDCKTDENVAFDEMRAIAGRNAELAKRVLDKWSDGAASVASVLASVSHENPFVLWIREHANSLTDKTRMTEALRRLQRKDEGATPAALCELTDVVVDDKTRIENLKPWHAFSATWRGIPVVARAFEDQPTANLTADQLLGVGLEADIVDSIGYPGLLRIYGQFQNKYVIYEAVESTLANASITCDDVAAKIVHGAACALAAMHASDVLHRLITPDAVFLAPDGSVRLGNLSMARTDDKSGNHTSVQAPEAFLAPEVKDGSSDPSCASDVYALGKTMTVRLSSAFKNSFFMTHLQAATEVSPTSRCLAHLVREFNTS